MLSRKATILLSSLRETCFGATEESEGVRLSATDASYEMHGKGSKDQKLDVTPEFYRGLLEELVAAGEIREREGIYSVFLTPLFEKEIPMFDVKTATMPEIVAKYNSLSDKPVKKFADRRTAEKRLSLVLKPAAAKVAKPAKVKVAKVRPEGYVSREAERAVRHGVEVNGKPYGSVFKAFEALNLPLGRHIAFRGKLKSSTHGRLAFEYEGKTFDFKLLKKAAK